MNNVDELTFAMLKPDAVERELTAAILDRLKGAGLTIVRQTTGRVSAETVDAHYAEHIGKPFFADLRAFTLSGPVVRLVLRGPNAVTHVRDLIGPTNPMEAPAGTIRGDLNEGSGVVRRNLIHASDSLESAQREIALHFPEFDAEEAT